MYLLYLLVVMFVLSMSILGAHGFDAGMASAAIAPYSTSLAVAELGGV